MSQNYQDVDYRMVALVGAVSVLGTLIVVLALEVGYYAAAASLENNPFYRNVNPAYPDALREQRAGMSDWRKPETPAGPYVVPAAHAMELVVRDLSERGGVEEQKYTPPPEKPAAEADAAEEDAEREDTAEK